MNADARAMFSKNVWISCFELPAVFKIFENDLFLFDVVIGQKCLAYCKTSTIKHLLKHPEWLAQLFYLECAGSPSQYVFSLMFDRSLKRLRQSLNFAIVDIFVDDFWRRPFLYAVTFFKNWFFIFPAASFQKNVWRSCFELPTILKIFDRKWWKPVATDKRLPPAQRHIKYR